MKRWAGVARAVSNAAALYAGAVTVLSVLNLVAPQSSGPLALTEILAPHLLLPVVILLPWVVARRNQALRIAAAAAVLLGVVRFGSGLVSLPPDAVREGEASLRFMSWNLEVGTPEGGQVLAVLEATDADVVALEELTPRHAALIDTDPEVGRRFPYRALYPLGGAPGIGILSRLPMAAVDHALDPAVVQVDLELPDGTAVGVVAAHPFPATISTVTSLPLPIDFDASRRDADIGRLRLRIDPFLARRAPIVVIGDFNLTDREPAYAALTRGLRDAYVEVGQGTGSTWRPDRFKFLPFGLLRIDYLLAGPGLRAIDVSQDCTPRGSDHCILSGRLVVEPGAPG